MLKVKDLPKDTQDELDRITSLPVNELTSEDIKFLHGRKDYLTSDQLKAYEPLFVEVKPAPKKEVKSKK